VKDVIIEDIYRPYKVKDPEPIDYKDGIEEFFIEKHRIRLEKIEENRKYMEAKRKKRRLLGKTQTSVDQ
jgi:hypothetical protein